MRATKNLRNVLRGLLQRYGTEDIKRRMWNHEYDNGRWECLDAMVGDCVYPHIEKYVKNGTILDLGCGPGAVGNQLNPAAYQAYTGVDICDVAITKAKHITERNGRTEKNLYLQSDILTYAPTRKYDVILFGDSIYYFSYPRIATLLNRYSEHLKQDGVFIVRSWILKRRHKTIIHNIEREFDVVEKRLYADSRIVVIVFRTSNAQPNSIWRGLQHS